MVGLLELIVFGFIGLSVAYIIIGFYARSTEREKLEKAYDAGGIEGAREDYINAGLDAYQGSLRRRLLWLVYIIPMAAIGLIAYVVNHQ